MTSTKVVIRLLTAQGAMLGAVVHQAAVKGDACLRASGPVIVTPDASGEVATVSVHWPDVNVETRVGCGSVVSAGVPLILFPHDAVLVQAGVMPGSLPAVTVSDPVVVHPLTGGIGARG